MAFGVIVNAHMGDDAVNFIPCQRNKRHKLKHA